MAEKHIVKFHFIAKFFGDGNRFLVRGENAFTSGHVTKFRFDGTVQPMRISAEVLPSMKKLNYTVEVCIYLTVRHFFYKVCFRFHMT